MIQKVPLKHGLQWHDSTPWASIRGSGGHQRNVAWNQIHQNASGELGAWYFLCENRELRTTVTWGLNLDGLIKMAYL